MRIKKIIILGYGLSGLLMILNLVKDTFNYEIVILEKKTEKELFSIDDDIPYYFNKKINIPDLELNKTIMNMSIWFNDKEHYKSNDELSNYYSYKILNQKCGNTLKFFKNEKEIFISKDNKFGSRKALMNFLYNKIKNKIKIIPKFENCVVGIDTKERVVINKNNKIYNYDFLINTIDLSNFISLTNLVISKDINFVKKPFYMATYKTNKSKYKAIYCSDRDVIFNRIAWINRIVFLESPVEFNIKDMSVKDKNFLKAIDFKYFNDPVYKTIYPGRFVALNKCEENYINNLFNKIGVYLLGRYGTWTFKLTENIWEDCNEIINDMEKKSD